MASIHTITVSHADRPTLTPAPIPQDQYFPAWVLRTLEITETEYPCEINIRTVEVDEMASLNQQYRNKTGPTNVLSFPLMEYNAIKALPFVGDIVICAPVVLAESEKQQKQLLAHWAHMVIHGTLHLLGYTHDKPTNIVIMEGLEKDILATFDFPDPYLYIKRARK